MSTKKKNIFDTEIEMIDLDSIGDLEFRYEELGSPNPVLGDDLNMVMKETQVFSSDEIEKALEKNAVEDMGLDLDKTRVIDSVEEIEGFLSEEEVAETVNEEVYEAPATEDTASFEASNEYSEETSEAVYEEASEDNSDMAEDTEYAETEEESYTVEEPEYEEAAAAAVSGIGGAEVIEKLEEDESYDFEEDVPKKDFSKNREKSNKTNTAKSVKNNKNNVKNKKRKKAKRNRDDDSEGGFGIFEAIGVVIAIALIVLLAVLGTKMFNQKLHKEEINQFASIGALFSDIEGLGNEGIKAVSEKAYLDSIAVSTQEVKDDVTAEEIEEEEEEEEEVAPVSVNFSSVEKDLKIKFTNKNNGKLITGVRFEVSAKGPNGKTYSWVDSDLDGIIYIDNLDPGNYEVKVISVDPYEFPETATIVKVQDTVVYQVINVIEEAVDMSQVNLAQEEKQANEVDQGTVLQDTVKLVESTATPINGQDGFVKVNKNDIKDPKTLATAFNWGGFRRVENINVTGITLSGPTEVLVGSSITIGATVSPEEATNKGLNWSSSDTNIATVDDSGNVTGVAAGPVTITATAQDGSGTSQTYAVTVKEKAPAVTITISGQRDMVAGEKITLSATVDPDNKEITWTLIDDAGAASITPNGKSCEVTANKKGTISVIAAEKDGSANASVAINIDDAQNVAVSEIVLSANPAEVLVGSSIAISKTINPSNATNQTLSWISSDNNVATVDANGNVTGVAAGKATITAKTADGSVTSNSVEITVKAASNLKLTVTDKDGKEITDKKEMFVSETLQLNAKVEGYQSDANVKYAASNDCVTVSAAGLITAVKVGTADVSITTAEKGADGNPITKKISVTVKADPTKNTTDPLKYTDKDGKEYQLYYKTQDGKYVEAKWADYYKYNEFYIKGEVEYKYTGWQTIEGNVYYFTEEGKKVTGEQIIGGTKYNFASDGSLVKASGTRGIDVSAYQGTIDWTAVKNSGISFVIIRCGFRGYTQGGLILDSKYKSYIQGATSAGLKVGLYIFSQAVNEREAVEEASLCVNLAQGYKISYPIFIDSEYSNSRHDGRADGLDKNTRTAVCRAFCETIKSAGYTPGIYASKSWYYNKLDVGQLNSYKIWLAHYCGQTDYSGKYDLWQHTSKGQVSGIKGNVDLDISYLGY
ncbi:MAG: Ig-like domain-containing protein [Lachnospiraceae bacterium]|nr:Ig-like domain-containing protein [Lachnospiraceae bacterium]